MTAHDRMLLMGALKQSKWEEAKGALRALVALSGSYSESDGQTEKCGLLQSKVSAFIADIEDHGLDE